MLFKVALALVASCIAGELISKALADYVKQQKAAA
jgi:hypothetical protein